MEAKKIIKNKLDYHLKHSAYHSLAFPTNILSKDRKTKFGNHLISISKKIIGQIEKLNIHMGSTTSYALVGNSQGLFYCQQGCCQGIMQFPAPNGYLYYYIPDVYGISLKKKIKYIETLATIITNREIHVMGVQDSTEGLFIPADELIGNNLKTLHYNNGLLPNVVDVIRYISTIPHFTEPVTFIKPTKKYIVVKVQVKSPREQLYFLQLLRAISQYLPFGRLVYNQPRLFFKLTRLFPSITNEYRLYLSFILSGWNVSQTYFPWFMYNNKYKRANLNVDPLVDNINSFVATSAIYPSFIKTIFKSNSIDFKDIEFVENNSTIESFYTLEGNLKSRPVDKNPPYYKEDYQQYTNNFINLYLSENLEIGSKKSLLNSIQLLAYYHKDKNLTEQIKNEISNNRN